MAAAKGEGEAVGDLLARGPETCDGEKFHEEVLAAGKEVIQLAVGRRFRDGVVRPERGSAAEEDGEHN